MTLRFETAGNATLIFHEDGRPVLATDPWLDGRCYSGSWALERKMTDAERQAVLGAEYIWISHGHPDHFHVRSLMQFPRAVMPQLVLVPGKASMGSAAWSTK
jgi:L-ascorbate metabolism protein UlaG (beta-lactamase superfamily)